jgi:DivIVA domain-containing protein
MSVDQTSLERIRNATFPSARRGYDKREVERFLGRLADWLETGGGDEARSDTVKKELERVGQRTGAILAQAEESAQEIRAEAEQNAGETVRRAKAAAQESKREADAYARDTKASADGYADQTRRASEEYADRTRQKADQEAREAIESAQAQARRIVEEGTRRRRDIEAVISDLVRKRDAVISHAEQLGQRLTGVVSEHRPAPGADPFGTPDKLDPGERSEPAAEPTTAGRRAEPETGQQAAPAGESKRPVPRSGRSRRQGSGGRQIKA